MILIDFMDEHFGGRRSVLGTEMSDLVKYRIMNEAEGVYSSCIRLKLPLCLPHTLIAVIKLPRGWMFDLRIGDVVLTS